jgi:predicted PurR-regulated permease PerM
MNWDRKTIFRVSLAAVFLGAFAALFTPFYGEILLAAVVALAMEPTLGRLFRPKHLRWRLSVALILILMFVAIAAPVSLVAYKGYAAAVDISKTGIQKTEAFGKFVEIKNQFIAFANKVSGSIGLGDQVDFSGFSEDQVSSIANRALGIATGTLSSIPSILLSVFIFCAALYFFLAEASVIKRLFYRQNLLEPYEADRFVETLQRASFSTVITSVVISIMQATIVSLGSLVFGVGDALVVFVVTFFCAFVPVIGAGPVALALAAYALLMGEVGHAIGLGVIALVAGTADNLVRPLLISSGEEDLHPVVSLLAIIGALILFGMPGLFLGPVIASVAVKIVPIFTDPPTVDAKDLAKKSI